MAPKPITAPSEARTITKGNEHKHITTRGPLNPRRIGNSETVTIVNMTDRPRSVMDMRNKSINLMPGDIVSGRDISTSQIERYRKRVPGLMFLPKEVVEHTEAPMLRYVLDELKVWEEKSEGEAIFVHDKVFGKGHLGIRPAKHIIREALAHRIRDAAQYVAAGAYDTAEKLLGKGNPEPVLVTSPEGGLKLEDDDIIKGTDDDEDNNQEGNTGGGDGSGDGGGDEDDGEGSGTGDGEGDRTQPQGSLSGAGGGSGDLASGEDDDGSDADPEQTEAGEGGTGRVKSKHAAD